MPIDVLRHLAATLASRAAEVLRDAPPGFAGSTFAPSTRRPVHIVAHMADTYRSSASASCRRRLRISSAGEVSRTRAP
jgi:hypothetical protein